MPGRTPHTRCAKGKKVRVILRSGGEVRGRFERRSDRHVVVGGTKIAKYEVRAFIIDKGIVHER